ncbi:MAG TPA: hypothetical protein VMI47_00065 [Pseudolabrys sp.]|nr:hypothetical protein [Pseudolabrys sp.]
MFAAIFLVRFVAAFSAFFILPAFALSAENLLVAVPPGYKVGHQAHNARQLITEMVPAGETVEIWTEMVTVQIFFGLHEGPASFRLRMEKLWASSCSGAKSAPVGGGLVNGYTTMTWRMSCPLNKQTGKPEITWFKAIVGNDSFYVVQKAFKAEPSPEKVAEWVKYLDGVSVCDTRLPERKCPAGMRE